MKKKPFFTEKGLPLLLLEPNAIFPVHLHPTAWFSVGTGYALLRVRDGDGTRRSAAQRSGLERGAARPEAPHAPCVTQSC